MAPPDAGARIVLVDAVLTGVFSVASVVAVVLKPGRSVAVVVDLALFAAGVVLCLVAFARAVVRSREELIAVSSLYFLAGSAPRKPRLRLLGCLAVQVVVGATAAGIRPFTSLAFGVLVPVWGVGMAGFWAARYGAYPPRPVPPVRTGPPPRR